METLENNNNTNIENNNAKTEKNKIGKTLLIIAVIAALLILEAFIIFHFFVKGTGANATIPEVRICADSKVKLSDESFSVPVTLSAMNGSELYPAASFSITFDNSRLEFLGLDEGNIMVLADENAQGVKLMLPEWKANTAFANQSGRINVMYLDSTAGRYAFCQDGFDAETGNILFEMKFRLRGNVKAGDIYNLVIMDACIAASDEKNSMAMTANTLRAVDGRLVISE